MNSTDVPPTVFVESALKAMAKAGIEATVIYVVDKNGKMVTRSSTNAQDGPIGLARHLAAARIQDGAIDRAAIALHASRVQMPPDVSDADRALMNVCPLCGITDGWEVLDDPGKEFHRAVVKLVVGHALVQPSAPGSLVSV